MHAQVNGPLFAFQIEHLGTEPHNIFKKGESNV